MLVLSRKVGDRIVIDNDIEVKVLSIDRGKIRLGITAPTDVPVWRSELLPIVKPDETPPGATT